MDGAGAPMENPKISAYYQTRLAHFGVLSTEWLAQAESATTINPQPSSTNTHTHKDSNFSVIEEFNKWRNHPDLAEAVAAIRALAAVISSSNASTMMQLEIELKNASDTLKVSFFLSWKMNNNVEDRKVGSGIFNFTLFWIIEFCVEFWFIFMFYSHGIPPLYHWQQLVICLCDMWQELLLWNMKISVQLNLVWLSVLISLGISPSRSLCVSVWYFTC